MSFFSFIKLMLPYSILSLLLLIVCCFLLIQTSPLDPCEAFHKKRSKKEKLLLILYFATFIVALLVVLRILPYYVGLLLILLPVVLFDRSILKKPDYSLLLTFVFLFIFIGNIKRIPAVHQLLLQIIKGHEVGLSVLLSQFISNVPAAVMLSGFTENGHALLLGVNLGGLGTMIASLASLISFQFYRKSEGAQTGRYFRVFTAVNFGMLGVLLVFALIL
jgi:Na+/H+ antiporter NhaD/arsenite permease-like protein